MMKMYQLCYGVSKKQIKCEIWSLLLGTVSSVSLKLGLLFSHKWMVILIVISLFAVNVILIKMSVVLINCTQAEAKIQQHSRNIRELENKVLGHEPQFVQVVNNVLVQLNLFILVLLMQKVLLTLVVTVCRCKQHWQLMSHVVGRLLVFRLELY